MTALVLHPSDLLDPYGFEEGLLCRSVLDQQLFSVTGVPRTALGTESGYASPRHLLRHLIRTHLLPRFPWASSMVMYQEPHGSPVRLWLHDEDGCPLQGRLEEVRSTAPVLLDEADLRRGVARVYPLRSAAQVALYGALDIPPAEHETALALLAPFQDLEDDVLVLAAELYPVARTHTSTSAVTPGLDFLVHDGANGYGRGDVLEAAGLLFDVVASARSLVH